MFHTLIHVEPLQLESLSPQFATLHIKHIEDVRKDVNYSSTDILVFRETRFSPLDPDDIYNINGYTLFRNGSSDSSGSGRPCGRTAVYSRIPLRDGYPFAHNIDGIEFTIIKTERHLDLTIITLYRSPGSYTTLTFWSSYYSRPTLFATKYNYWRFQYKLGARVHTSFAL